MGSVLDIISEHWISHAAYKAPQAKTLWFDANSSVFPKSVSSDKAGFFSNRFAYLIPDDKCFPRIQFDNNDFLEIGCERYGGLGLGSNGGGGRSGNLNEYQLKGIGPTAMVGRLSDTEHSYGGLDAAKAIIETIYTKILKQILPVGVIDIHGIILVDTVSGFDGDRNCWGAILVRDRCIRPAHFLPAPDFKPLEKYRRRLISETGRIRRLYSLLPGHFTNPGEFIKWIAAYLHNTAKQFAFSRAMRLTHGTVSASNLSIDGKWLDLPVCSFLPGGTNYNIWTEFFDEHCLALDYALEIIYTHGKYSRLSFDTKILIDLYDRSFSENFRESVGYVLGIKHKPVADIFPKEWDIITDAFYRTIHSSDSIVAERPRSNTQDPVISLIAGIFLSFADPAGARACLSKTKLPDNDAAKVIEAAGKILARYAETHSRNSSTDKKYVIISCALIALRRGLLAELFYLPAVKDQVDSICNRGTPDDVSPLIDRFIRTSHWVFDEHPDKVCLFNSETLEVTFSPTDSYCIRNTIPGIRHRFTDIDGLLHYLTNHLAVELDLNGFNFLPYFKYLRDVINPIETYINGN